ncbi:MAG: molybdopterin-binding protein [Deltaproteobacteria bacterium HGW-Deltaproteobacteria-12]|jgi:molybdenum cofactor synthesis domain-containing protein|nr:MAG: molybdopterin-binding protein [Deltaproteobacteria bacterium HGW-Deltaproteobacteria-12]
MKQIKVEEAVGTILAHDLTEIIPGVSKGAAFKRGHVVKAEDIPALLRIGKKHLYVFEIDEDQLHEDDAALRIARALCGDNLKWTEPREGKSKIISNTDGLIKINVSTLLRINSIGEIIVSTIKTGMPCRNNQVIAETRIIPLVIARSKMEELESVVFETGPILKVLPYTRRLVGIVVTGSEVYEGLIKDESERFIVPKLKEYGCELVEKIIVTDDYSMIAQAIEKLRNSGCELILTTGGLSVDPDDVTRIGIRESGAEIISYGGPILPGGMFLNARLGDVPVLGLPACVFHSLRTVFDLMLPLILAGEQPSYDDIAAMGHGGLCMKCEVCHFPACSYGR